MKSQAPTNPIKPGSCEMDENSNGPATVILSKSELSCLHVRECQETYHPCKLPSGNTGGPAGFGAAPSA